jgi:hypothetical protein
MKLVFLLCLVAAAAVAAGKTGTNSSHIHCKKRLAVFPSPAAMSLTKLSLGGNKEIFFSQGEFGL